jgi:DNA-binding IclR family transcriptional regulator
MDDFPTPSLAVETAGAAPKARSAERSGNGIQSLERAFDILEEIAQHQDGINLADLTKRVELHNSTTFHLTKTMVSLGYVQQNPSTKRYHIGTRLFTLAASAFSEVTLVSLATPILEDLARDTGETAHFAIMSGNDVVVAARAAGPGALQLAFRQGGIWPAHCTALGKVLLAGRTEAQFEAFLTSQPLVACTPMSITDPARLRVEIERTRKAGVGFDDGEFDREVRCMAVPVFDFAGRVAGAIGVSGPILRLTLPLLEQATQRVIRAASLLSKELGGIGGSLPNRQTPGGNRR